MLVSLEWRPRVEGGHRGTLPPIMVGLSSLVRSEPRSPATMVRGVPGQWRTGQGACDDDLGP